MRRGEGVDEPILDPTRRIVDAHHHLFDRPGMRYMPQDYLDDALSGHNVVATVYVEGRAFFRNAGPDILKPLGEVEFANGIGAMADGGAFSGTRLCAGIVGYADLRLGQEVGTLLDRAMSAAPDRFRGIRQITLDHPSEAPWRFILSGRPPAGILQHPLFNDGVREVARRHLVLDIAGFDTALPDFIALADAFPDLTMVLNNLGNAMFLDLNASERSQAIARWRSGIVELARRRNVVCKISGLGLPFWGFGFSEQERPVRSHQLEPVWRPFVEAALEAFGADRCMVGSNYPPDARSCGFVPLFNTLKQITAGCSEDEKDALFSQTAARIYRLAI